MYSGAHRGENDEDGEESKYDVGGEQETIERTLDDYIDIGSKNRELFTEE